MNLWVVEVHELGAVQVRPVGDATRVNLERFLAGLPPDRLLLGVAGSVAEAVELEKMLRKLKREGGGAVSG